MSHSFRSTFHIIFYVPALLDFFFLFPLLPQSLCCCLLQEVGLPTISFLLPIIFTLLSVPRLGATSPGTLCLTTRSQLSPLLSSSATLCTSPFILSLSFSHIKLWEEDYGWLALPLCFHSQVWYLVSGKVSVHIWWLLWWSIKNGKISLKKGVP